jgi:hypothetical protein
MTKMNIAKIVLASGLLLACGIADPVYACSWNPVAVAARDGKIRFETGAEARRREIRVSSDQIVDRANLARVELSEGKADIPADLAELLVPNVRPIYIEYSMCDGGIETDFAGDNDHVSKGLDLQFKMLVTGTLLEPQEYSNFVLPQQIRTGENMIPYPGDDCNPEFRVGFSRFLTARHSKGQLEAIWLFLKPRDLSRNSKIRRLMSFDRRSRVPPVRWDTYSDTRITKDIRKWLTKPEGKALQASIDDFWRVQGPLLTNDAAICPNAATAWPQRKATWLQWALGEYEKRNARRKTPIG